MQIIRNKPDPRPPEATMMSTMLDRRLFLSSVTALAGAALLVPGPAAAARLRCVATTAIIGDALRSAVGEAVDLRVLMGEGVDPHSYQATRSDIAALASADIVVWHGLHLEAQFERLMGDLARRRPVVALAQALAPARLIANPDFADRYDPHVWMDPALWKEMLTLAAGTLSPRLPGGAPALADRLSAALAEVDALDAYARRVLGAVEPGRRVLVTAHDAFAYFGRAFGFEVAGIQGISTDSEAGLADVARIVDLVVSRRVPAVFVESSVPERNVRAIVEGAAAKGHAVRIGATLFSDALGPAGTYEGTWLGMMDHNVTAIARALGGGGDGRGRLGRLAAAL
jgi:manganese/zinc/iron transport system substrate-binding protein